MEKETENWIEIYNSLHIEMLRNSGRWRLVAILMAGILLIAFCFLVFRKYPEFAIIMSIAVFILAGRYAFGLYWLHHNPRRNSSAFSYAL